MIVEFDHDPTGIHRPLGTRWELAHSRLAMEAIRTRQALRGSLPDGPVADEMAAWRERAGLRHLILSVEQGPGNSIVISLDPSRGATRPGQQ